MSIHTKKLKKYKSQRNMLWIICKTKQDSKTKCSQLKKKWMKNVRVLQCLNL